MKKLAILATMFAAVTLASCGGAKEEGEATEGDSTAVEAEATTEEVAAAPAAEETKEEKSAE